MSENRSLDAQFAELLVDHQDKLRVLIGCSIFNKQEVDDILQEVNVILLDKVELYNFDRSFFAWASAVVRFAIKSYLRDRKRQRVACVEELADMLFEPAARWIEDEYSDRCEILDQCVRERPTRQQDLLRLKYELGFSNREIAEHLGHQMENVRQIFHRIRLALIACVAKKLES